MKCRFLRQLNSSFSDLIHPLSCSFKDKIIYVMIASTFQMLLDTYIPKKWADYTKKSPTDFMCCVNKMVLSLFLNFQLQPYITLRECLT